MAPRYKASEREEALSETRSSLLNSAAEEFAREGFATANINRISSSAGFAKGTIYNYFDSKRALMQALIDETAEVHLEFVGEQVLQEDHPARRLKRFFEAGFAFVTDHLPQARVMFTTLNGADLEFKQRMAEAYAPMFQLVGRHILAAGIERGIFRPVDLPTATALIMTLYLGAGSQLDEQGRHYLAAKQVADFALRALRRESETQ
ncbi:MAG: hypothetical protein BMS9Abin28_2352 [Anaerolineae bacterium]|nr:MAG: hypothetical protein BMS9Abin28_2352 [Anaerolineae bacterium]